MVMKIPANIYLFNNKNTRKRCEICSELTNFSSVSIVEFEQVNVALGFKEKFQTTLFTSA